ncbi:glycosyltransferase family 2 protein [Moraxella sp. FZLJ2107]|uniref:tetratricopeptide repeat protein n=1 Tax=unclassified Moraxella TaxID=2685852 RepID=UPI0020C8AD72|nr:MULTISPECIES: tetratricopeptide repeat protein [unclassified Moraxella]UTO06188.1 glycosyltransferase family 2 protein [Moraxella sp. FZLJ2107]UTO23465.1 glycosyltransferase family 2 protein [Moraxella sp. FZLJ2109]
MDINNIKQLIDVGYQAFGQKNYEQAIKAWQPIINFCQNKNLDDLLSVYLDLGKCYYRTHEYKKAKQVIDQGLAKFPADVNLLKLQGFNDEKTGEYKSAIIAWQKVLRQHPDHVEAQQHIRDITKIIERKKLKEQELSRQNEISEELQEFLNQVDVAMQTESSEVIDHNLQFALSEVANNYQLLLRYAQNAQNADIKLQRFATLLHLYPHSDEALFGALETAESIGEFDRAKKMWHTFCEQNEGIDFSLYEKYAEHTEKSAPRESFFRWLDIHRQFPLYSKAAEKLKTLGGELDLVRNTDLKISNHAQIISLQHKINQLFVSGKSAFYANNYLDSNRIWQQAVDMAEDKSLIPEDLYLGLGKSYIRSGELDLAKKIVLLAMDIYPNQYNIHFLLPFIAKKEKDLHTAELLWTELTQKFPKEMSAKIELAQNYQQLNELAKAKKAYQDAIHVNNNYFDAYLGLARVMMKQGDHQGSLEAWLEVKDKWPDKINGHLGAAICHKNLSEYEKAFQTIEQAFGIFPSNVQLLDELVDVIYRSQDYQKGYDKLEKLVFDNTEVLEYQKARLLVKLKKFDEAEQKFKAVIEQYPNFARVYLGFADLYTGQRKEKEAVDILKQGYNRFQKNELIIARLIDALVAYGEKEEAYRIYTILPHNDTAKNLFKYRNLINQFSDKKVNLEKLYQLYPDNVDIAVKVANIKLDSYNKEVQNQGIDILYKIKQDNPNLKWIKNTIVMGLLKCNREDEALQVAKTIPKTQNDPDTLKVLAWLAQKEGEFDKSKDIWQEIINKKHILSVNGNIGDLTYKGDKEIIVEKDDILMFSTMFNEMIHIPFLLDYYRKLGVNKFFITDNNSTDETAEYLLAQPDVYYFWASSSYKEAGDGMAWSNYLMDKYAQGNWCVVIDADEYLVYPNIENKKLPELTKYLDEHGYEALASFMLAMYPEDVEHQLAIKSSDNLIEKSPYFCNYYHFRGDVHCPYIHVSGGFYYKKNGQTTWCTKTPLIKRKKGVKHIASNHLITSAKVADITSCLLHLKLVGDFEKKAKANIERKEHSGGGDAYKEYIRLSVETGKFTDVEGTTKYDNSQQLVELGLIKNPRGF